MAVTITLAEAKAKFSAVVSDVLHKKQRYLIRRHGKPVAAIVSIEELASLEAGSPLSEHPAGALALVGAWDSVDDEAIDAVFKEIMDSRARDTGRPVDLERLEDEDTP